MSDASAYIPISSLLEPYWPALLGDFNAPALDAIYATPANLVFNSSDESISLSTTVIFSEAYSLSLSLLPSVVFALGESATESDIPLEVSVTGLTEAGDFDLSVTIGPVPLSLTIGSSLFKPVEHSTVDGVDTWKAKEGSVTFTLGSIGLQFDTDGNFDFDSTVALDVSGSPFMIADTDIVIASGTITPHIGPSESSKYLGFDDIVVYLPASLSRADGSRIQLTADNVSIGAGGFSGDLSVSNVPTLSLFGMSFDLTEANISVIQNTLTACSITGALTLPFFSDGSGGDLTVTVDVAIGQDGALHVELSDLDDDGIVELDLPIGDGSKLRLTSIGFDSAVGGSIILGGDLVLGTVGGTTLPTLSVSGLKISSDGTVTLPAGGITLQQQLSIDLYGFNLTIDSFGIGTEQLDSGTYNFVSLSGGISLPDPLPVGVSAKGLRLLWPASGSFGVDDLLFTIEGIGVELTIPEVLYFGGEVSLIGQELRGSVALYINAIDLLIDAELIIGEATDEATGTTYKYFYISIDAELPAGIPLGATGLGLFGFQGLFIHNMVPTAVKSNDNQSADFNWYTDWYRPSPAGIDGSKFVAQYGGEGLGAGTTLGTMADNGYIFASKIALVLLIPGPIIMLTGTGNLLRTRNKLDDDPTKNLFDSLIVFDGASLSLLAALGMRYDLPSADQDSKLAGTILNIEGSAEAFYDFDDSANWHVYLGTDAEPIRATIFKLFTAESYVMLDNNSARAGTKIGIDESYGVDVVSVVLKSIMEGSGEITWAPQHFAGELILDGELGIKVFGFEFGFTAHADIAGSSPHDKTLEINLEVTVDLPKPFDDISVTFAMAWRETHTPAPISPLISDTGLVISDTKTAATWTLTATTDSSFDESRFDNVVPMDAHPLLTFNRIVEDVPMIGIPQPIADYETVNSSTAYKYSLDSLALHKWQDASWQSVTVTGMWQANSQDAGTVLELYGNSPFGYMRQTGTGSSNGSENYLITSPYATLPDTIVANSTYPLRLNLDQFDFQATSDGDDLQVTHYTPDSSISFKGFDSRNRTAALVVKDNTPTGGQKGITLNWPTSGNDKAGGARLEVNFTQPIKAVSLQCFNPSPSETIYLDIDAIRADGSHVYASPSYLPQNGKSVIALPADFSDVTTLFIRSRENPSRASSVDHLGQTYFEAMSYYLMSAVAGQDHTIAQAPDTLTNSDDLLESSTYYRLTVGTKTAEKHSGSVVGPDVVYAYFKTDGPRDDFTPYVESVALANNGLAHYTAYDIVVNTNENYIDKLYSSLTLRIYNESNEELTAEEGITASWSAYAPTKLPYYRSLWQDVCADAGLGSGSTSLTSEAQNDALYFKLSDQVLSAGQAVTAKLFYETTAIWTTQLKLSRYANFTDVIANANPTIYSASCEQASTIDPSADFDATAYDVLALQPSMLADRLDITAIKDSAEVIRALFVRLPETVDRARLTIQLSTGSTILSTVDQSSADGARHILVPTAADGSLASLAHGALSVDFSYAPTKDDMVKLSYNGDTTTESASLSITLT